MDGDMSPNQLDDLPGFRFHPTEEELIDFYLKNMISGKKWRCDIIGYLNIYDHDPGDLPGLSKIGEREWYFFVPRNRKHGVGGRPNRTTAHGFWKATGTDRKIVSLSSEPKRVLGFRKTLVFYKGRAPSGSKTDWIMNEYRLPKVEDIVLCKIYRKATSWKVLEQRAALEEETKACQQQKNKSQSPLSSSPISSSMDRLPLICSQQEDTTVWPLHHHMVPKEEVVGDVDVGPNHDNHFTNKGSCLQVAASMGKEKLPEVPLQLSPDRLNLDWHNPGQDGFWLTSPWLQTALTTPSYYANILNF